MPEPLRRKSIDSDMNAGFMRPFMYAGLRLKEHGPVLLHELTHRRRSPETCLTFSFPRTLSLSLSLPLLDSGVC